MKRFALLFAAAAALLLSCQPEDKTLYAEFGQTFYPLYADGEVDVPVILSKEAGAELQIPILVSGNAVEGTDFSISSGYAVFAAGEKEAFITVKNLAMTEDKSITLTLGAGSGYQIGTKYVTILTPDDQEALVYSFKTEQAVLLESYKVTVSLSGTRTGSDFKAVEAISVPLIADGEGAGELILEDIVIPAGESSGSATIQFRDPAFSGEKTASITVSPEAYRLIPGDKDKLTLQLRGVQTPDKLLGTWTFDSIYNLEEIELWFLEYEDDVDALPTHNEGFTLTFAKEGNDVILIPGGTGDFNKFFRRAKVKLAHPYQTVAGAVQLGEFTTEEGNMFIAEVAEPYQQNTYYELEKVNLAFSSNEEALGAARIVLRITPDGDLCTEFREYANADEFGMMWWSDGWDSDMFSFPALFKKTAQ